MRYTIAGRNNVKCKDTTLGAPALGGFGVFGDEVLGRTSWPDPGHEHPPPEQSRLHFCPSQCSLQFPPGHDITHISAPVSQYISQFPLVHVWTHCFDWHLMLVQFWPQFWVQLSAVHVNVAQWPPAHELSQFFAVQLTSQAPWAQVCSQRFDSLLLHSKLHLPPVHVLSHSEASHFMLQGPLQSCVHSLEPVTDTCDHYGFISTFHSGADRGIRLGKGRRGGDHLRCKVRIRVRAVAHWSSSWLGWRISEGFTDIKGHPHLRSASVFSEDHEYYFTYP